MVFAGLLGLLLVVQLPRGWQGGPAADPAQLAVLRRVEAADRRCHEHHIAAADAVAALDPLPIPGGAGENAWRLLAGSPDPTPHQPAEVRGLLTESPGPPP